jgi:outer membrane protein assembly factor BamB
MTFAFLRCPAFLLILIGSAVHAVEAEWPQFRGPTGQGISAARDLPTSWNATQNVAWKVAVPGRGWSSPVLAGGKVFLTSAVTDPGSSDATLHAVCLDAKDGRLIWDTEVFRPDPAGLAVIHRKNSPASATPIIHGDRLYVHFGHMGTAALDLAGQVRWRQLELGYPPTHGNGGSPVLIDGTLIFSADGQENPAVVALATDTGKLRWKTPRQSSARKQFSFSTPLVIEVAGGNQVISPTSGFVGAYDPGDGRELWRTSYGEGYSVVPRPVFAHGLVFVSSGYDQPSVLAIRPQGAAGDVTASHVAWTHKKGAPLTPSMLAVGDELYFVSDGGIATCADARTGTVHWSERLGGDFSASPISAEGRIYFQNESGIGFVVKAGTQFELLAKNELGERTLASSAAVDGALFIRSEAHLWKIGR